MKLKITFLLLIAIIVSTQIYAITDTLRYYRATDIPHEYYIDATTYTSQYARFEPQAPGYVNAITLTLGGTVSTGSVTVHLFGHEGGATYPEIQTDLITPLTFTKTAAGIQKVTVTLPTPVSLDNNQFFLKVTDFAPGILLLCDNETHPATCSSTSGGDFYNSYVDDATTTYYVQNDFAIDVIMDYAEDTISPQLFQDVSSSSGIGDTTVSLGICWGDYNNDHQLDLLTGGKLYRNNGDGTFTDVTLAAGITKVAWRNSFIDINNDGKEDIIFIGDSGSVTGGNWLYINNGDGTFTEQPLNLSPAPNLHDVRSFAIADINNDKYPDLLITQWETVTPVASGVGYGNYLYINNRNNGFNDSTTMIYYPGYPFKPAYGSMWMDFNDDNKLDLYVSNYRLQRDEFWQNNGNGTFTNIVADKGIDINNQGGSNHGTGVDWADYDNDGDMDLLLPQLVHPSFSVLYDQRPTTIYRNEGAPNYSFTDMNPGVNAGTIGIEYEETHVGAAWGDLNSDGLTDFITTTVYGCRFADVYLQNPNHTFSMKTFDYGIQNLVTMFDAATVDYNNDGRLDMSVGNTDYFMLFKNNGNYQNNYVSIDLVSTSGNHFGIGSKVVVYAGGNKYTQYQIPYHGCNMGKSNRLFFGLGKTTSIDSVVVRWPNGTLNTETFTGLAINDYNILTEGGQVVSGIDNKPDFSKIEVYPNPTNQLLNIKLPANMSMDAITIISSGGVEVYKESMDKTTVKSIDVKKLTPGYYMLRINTSNGVYNSSFEVLK